MGTFNTPIIDVDGWQGDEDSWIVLEDEMYCEYEEEDEDEE